MGPGLRPGRGAERRGLIADRELSPPPAKSAALGPGPFDFAQGKLRPGPTRAFIISGIVRNSFSAL